MQENIESILIPKKREGQAAAPESVLIKKEPEKKDDLLEKVEEVLKPKTESRPKPRKKIDLSGILGSPEQSETIDGLIAPERKIELADPKELGERFAEKERSFWEAVEAARKKTENG